MIDEMVRGTRRLFPLLNRLALDKPSVIVCYKKTLGTKYSNTTLNYLLL